MVPKVLLSFVRQKQMFPKGNSRVLEEKVGDFVKPRLPPVKSSSAILKYGWNYDDKAFPVSEELRRKLRSQFDSDPELSQKLNKLLFTIEKVKQFKSRTVVGACSTNAQNSYTCQCCKFSNPVSVLENQVFGLIARLSEPSLYNGISVYELVPESQLGDLAIPPDRAFLFEIQNSNYLWRDHISRFFSRMHWVAVAFETRRLFNDWLDFMHSVNDNNNVWIFNDGAVSKEVLTRLMPALPPRPEKGDFLFSVGHQENLRRAVRERVEVFNSVAYVFDGVPVEVSRFLLCDVYDHFTLYSDADGQPNGLQVDPLVSKILLQRERNRRMVNSVREIATSDYACYETPPLLIGVMESLADNSGSTAYTWNFSNEDLAICNWLLGGKLEIWTPFIPGETDTTTANYFTCTQKNWSNLLTVLFIQRPCSGWCHVSRRTFRDLEEVQNLAYITCEYAIAVEVVNSQIEFEIHRLEAFISANCVAERFVFEHGSYEIEGESCVLVYKFEYSVADNF